MPNCNQCGDTGTVSRPVGVGDLMGVEPCDCVSEPETCQTCGGSKVIPLIDFDDDGLISGSTPKPCPACQAVVLERQPPQPAPQHCPASEPVEPWRKQGDAEYEQFQAESERRIALRWQLGYDRYQADEKGFQGDPLDRLDEELDDARFYAQYARRERNHLAGLLRRAFPLIARLNLLHVPHDKAEWVALYDEIEAVLEGLPEVEK